MSSYRDLTCLVEGESAKVTAILTKGSMRRRLLDLGLVEGACVKCSQKSPYGDPVAYIIRGATIALRHQDAKNILVV